MPDVLDPLRRLASSSLAAPESVTQLRDRSLRRKRRQAVLLLPLLAVGVVIGVALARDGDGDQPQEVRLVDDPTSTTTAAPGAIAPLTEEELDGAPGSPQRVVSGETGIVLIDLDERTPPRRLTDQPTLLAFGTRIGVVAQLGEHEAGEFGPVVVFDEQGQRELVTESVFVHDAGEGPRVSTGGHVQLHDVGVLDGRPVAVIVESSGADPASWDVRLFLVDVATGERTDLGSVGGWEDGVADAKFTARGVFVLTQWTLGHGLELRRLDGSTAWEVPGGVGEDVQSMALFGTDPTAIYVFETSFEDDFQQPHLLVRRFDPATGEQLDPSIDADVDADPSTPIETGFCSYVEIGASLLCDHSDGPPLEIDTPLPGDEVLAARRALDAPDRGVTTLWRQ